MTAAEIAEVSRQLYARGWMDATAGNISVRTGPTVLITASGVSKGSLNGDDVVEVQVADGQPVAETARRPSAETEIHLALYRQLPECGAVVHAHPPYSTVVAGTAASRGQTSVRFEDYEIIKGLSVADPSAVEVPLFENFADVPRIGDAIAAHLQRFGADAPVLLIGHHGATAWGPTLESARNRLECLEALCQLSLITHNIPEVSK